MTGSSWPISASTFWKNTIQGAILCAQPTCFDSSSCSRKFPAVWKNFVGTIGGRSLAPASGTRSSVSAAPPRSNHSRMVGTSSTTISSPSTRPTRPSSKVTSFTVTLSAPAKPAPPLLFRSGAGKAGTCAHGRLRRAYAGDRLRQAYGSCPAYPLRRQRVDARRVDQALDLEVLALGTRKAARGAVVDRGDPVAGEDARVREPAHGVAVGRGPEDLRVALVDRADELVALRDLGTRRADVDLPVDPVVREAALQLPDPLGERRPRLRHRHRRRHADVEEEIRAAGRTAHAPREAAAHRADVDDARLVAVARPRLPVRDPLEHCAEHVAHPHDRVLLRAAAAEGGVHERPLRREPHPDRPVVAEHDPLLGRLTEHAHVGDAAVRDEVARAGRVAAVLRLCTPRP